VPEVKDYQIYAGTAAPINFNGLVRHYFIRSGANVGDIQVNLVDKHERDRSSHEIARSVRALQAIASAAGATKVVEVPPGPPVWSPIVAEVYGPTQAAREAAARAVQARFVATADLVDVDIYLTDPSPSGGWWWIAPRRPCSGSISGIWWRPSTGAGLSGCQLAAGQAPSIRCRSASSCPR
jgi:multidrug efflux pump subunit AcrB